MSQSRPPHKVELTLLQGGYDGYCRELLQCLLFGDQERWDKLAARLYSRADLRLAVSAAPTQAAEPDTSEAGDTADAGT